MNKPNRIWFLMARYFSAEANPQEQAELRYYLDEDDELQQQFNQMKEIWGMDDQELPDSVDYDKQLKRILQKASLTDNANNPILERKLFVLRPLLKYAAAVIIVVGLAVLFQAVYRKAALKASDNKVHVITAKKGTRIKSILPDGTQVWLNAGSKLTYNNAFGEKYREVSLTGEAFFDVVKDAKHPFIVKTHAIRLKVLGTVFNVRSYEDDLTTEASLIRGKIQVTLAHNPDKEIILKPSEKLVVKNAYTYKSKKQNEPGKAAAVRAAEIPLISLNYVHQCKTDVLPAEAQWIENTLVFDGETLDEVAKRMERWYNVSIKIENTYLKALKFTGKFKNESLDEALRALQATAYFHFNITGKQVIIN